MVDAKFSGTACIMYDNLVQQNHYK